VEPTAELADFLVEPVVRAALAEDLGLAGDVTSEACIDPGARLAAAFVARQEGVLAGLACARLAFHVLDPTSRFTAQAVDGARIFAGQTLARIEADARAVLAGERVALNLLCRLSGIASATAEFVAQVKGTNARIVETRKTTPGLRALEKHAVRCGGGASHRFGLFDAILIKDNHIAACGGVGPALARTRARVGHMTKIEVEVDSLDQLREALEHEPDIVMLDNFALDELRQAVAIGAGRVTLEASGGVDLRSVRQIAATGVDIISVGAITHSAPALDIGLDVVA
jgi:nicotinate-nucleotide pyrophosphorylase (carboxylating)